MIELDLQTGLYLLAAVVIGIILGWFIRSLSSTRSLDRAGNHWQQQVDQADLKNASLASSLEEYQAAVHNQSQVATKTQAQIDSLVEKLNTLSRKMLAVSAERDKLKDKLSGIMALVSAGRQHMEEQKAEIARVSDFYKGQLDTAVEQRTELARKIDHADSENESLKNLLMSTKSEHEAVSSLLTTTQSRLKILDDVEQRAISLEAEIAELRDAATLDNASAVFGLDAPDGEPDDLTEIVGIGKVFEATLHDLGVYHFRQIAAFGPAEIDQINAELKEFKGRIEHDDWIGQAKELQSRKYEDIER